ncbi:hypothetical protein Glove_138g3 [Diversispora epigaea]|uniref:Uncharacterized protein n=1 Tax=Diversispora epigaea TaxID=1348612 RepID=A0A397IW44_9GLOM|nr:hypothetical protein Glove_138g3 [Diversispora epigaea]
MVPRGVILEGVDFIVSSDQILCEISTEAKNIGQVGLLLTIRCSNKIISKRRICFGWLSSQCLERNEFLPGYALALLSKILKIL